MTVLLEVRELRGSTDEFRHGGPIEIDWVNDTHFNLEVGTEWQGKEDLHNPIYNLDFVNMRNSLDRAEQMLERWGGHEALGAFQPIGRLNNIADLPSIK